MQVLDPLTDLYSHKRRAGMLSNAVRKTTAPSAPVMSGPGIADMPQGYEEGGMLAGPMDWAKRNIVQPVQNFVSNLVPSTPAPVNPTPPPQNIGTGYVQQSGVQPIQSYQQRFNQAAREAEGYAESGGITDDPLKRISTSPAAAVARNVVAGAAYPGAAIQDVGAKILNTGNAFLGGDKDYFYAGNRDELSNYTPTGRLAPTGAKYATSYGPQDDLKSLPSTPTTAPTATPKAPTATTTPSPTATDTAVKAATAPMPAATASTDPLTTVDTPDTKGSGFAQVGQKKIGINDIGVQGKDPLTAGTGTINDLTEEQFKRSGLAADPNFGKAGMEFNPATKTWEKPDPTIMVGSPGGIQSTMKESEAFNKGLMSPHQRDSYLNRQILEKQATLESQVKGADIEEKKAIANWHNSQAAGGGGQPSAYKDVRIAEQAKMDAEGVTDPVVRNQRILAAEIDFKKKSSTASSRITQALDIKTGKVVPITGEDIKNNPGQYVSSSDPDVKSLTGITKSMDQIGAFSKGVEKSFDLVDKLSDAYSKRTIPGVNKFSQYLSYQAGDTQVKAFQNALTTAMVEYMKVTNAGSGIGAAELTIEGQKRAANLLSTADSPATIKNAIAVMKKEMDIKNAAFVGQRNEIYNRLGVNTGGAAPAPAAAPNMKVDMSKPVHNGQVQGYKQADGSILDANGKRLN